MAGGLPFAGCHRRKRDWPPAVPGVRQRWSCSGRRLPPLFPRDAPERFAGTWGATLRAALPALYHPVAPGGVLWISWPRKAARVVTDITEDVIRDFALPFIGVVVKVCAVDAVRSGLKLMIRRTARAGLNAAQ